AQLSEFFHHRRRDRRAVRRIAELFRLSRSATTCPRESAAPAACTEEKINEYPRPQRHPPEGHHRSVARLTQGLFAARSRARVACTAARDRARCIVGRAAAAGLT